MGIGTGIDHRPGRTCSTGGRTLSSHASFCTVPVTTTTTGTVHAILPRVTHPPGALRTGRDRRTGSRRPIAAGSSAARKSLNWGNGVPTMLCQPTGRQRPARASPDVGVGRGVVVDHFDSGIGQPGIPGPGRSGPPHRGRDRGTMVIEGVDRLRGTAPAEWRDRYARMLACRPDAFFEVDVTGMIIEWNPRAEYAVRLAASRGHRTAVVRHRCCHRWPRRVARPPRRPGDRRRRPAPDRGR